MNENMDNNVNLTDNQAQAAPGDATAGAVEDASQTAGDMPQAWQDVIARQNEMIDALNAQNARLSDQIGQLIRNGASINDGNQGAANAATANNPIEANAAAGAPEGYMTLEDMALKFGTRDKE